MATSTTRPSRRNFMRALGAGGAAAAAALVAKQPAPHATGSAETSAVARGYQESAHVRNYYRTAKV